VGFRIPKNWEFQKILKFRNPEPQKSKFRNSRESRIPEISIPKIGIPGQFSGLIPKILEKNQNFFCNFFGFFSKKSVKSHTKNVILLVDYVRRNIRLQFGHNVEVN